jgi:hypothetical protein
MIALRVPDLLAGTTIRRCVSIALIHVKRVNLRVMRTTHRHGDFA